jgi:dethiobiotin synthetase
MPLMNMKSCYITGTDTGIGKSVASAALLHALRARGWRAVGMKPVASGCEMTADGWRNEDALALQQASDPVPAYGDVNPYALPHPLAPELAAADAGVAIELQPIVDAHARLAAITDAVVVEGVGGWAAPLTTSLDQLDVVRALKLPVVMVVGLRLGCINHARLTARAIAADGVALAGWIANDIDPLMARSGDNFAILQRVLPVPCLGRLPHAMPPDPQAMARHLQLPSL